VIVRIFGSAPTAAVLAGLLASKQHEVVWNPGAGSEDSHKQLKRTKEIRLVLPWGWVRTDSFRLSSSSALRRGELGVIAGWESQPVGRRTAAPGGRSLFLDCDRPEDAEETGERPLRGLSLFEALQWDAGVVEVGSSRPCLILQRSPELRELERSLKDANLEVLEVDELSPYANSLGLWNLLSLPLGLCHSTLGSFLSYPEGREIAVLVLEEGLRLYSHKELPLARLPFMDPQSLLQRLRKKGKEFDGRRSLPGRAYGNALLSLLHGEEKKAREPNDRLVRMSAQTGIEPRWNWALARKANRVRRAGFYRDPVELYGAVS
jgi:hypothetical protein